MMNKVVYISNVLSAILLNHDDDDDDDVVVVGDDDSFNIGRRINSSCIGKLCFHRRSRG